MDQLTNPQPFKLERIVPETWRACQRLFPSFFAVAVALYLVTWLPQLELVNPSTEISFTLWSGMMAASLVWGVVFLVLAGAVVFAVWSDTGTTRPQFGTAIRKSGSRILPMIGAAILWWLAMAAGTLAFVIPGFILYMMFLVAIPVVVIEGAGPVEAMERSRDLTRGHRLGLFMLIVLVGICTSLPAIVISFMFFDFGMGSEPNQIWNAVYGVYSALILLVQYAGLGVIYRGLRSAEALKESAQLDGPPGSAP